MGDYVAPPSARRVQFKEPECDYLNPCFVPKPESREPPCDLGSPLTRTVQFRDAGSDRLGQRFAPRMEAGDTPCVGLNSPRSGKEEFKGDDNNRPIAPKTGSKDSGCAYLNTGKAEFKSSVCDDPSPSFAPAVDNKDYVCDNLCFTPRVQLDDSLRDDFNPSSTITVDSKDSICRELNSTSECKGTSEDHIAPNVDGTETGGDGPNPASAPKMEDRKKLWFPCANPGNPIFSCMEKVPASPHSPTPFAKPQNPLYKTTSADYGSNEPTCDIAPSVYKPLSQSFSEALYIAGMYRNRSLNTGLDKKRVHDLLQL